MDKNKQKKEYASYNPLIIQKLKTKYGMTTQFINASLRGDRTSDSSLKICEDYKLMTKAINKAINEL
ncbi:hypothetical protein QWY99_21980 [Flavobacterium branchiarum]|uniref:XRE family transcriptional regulator n=1 Tax=Flavobacterium branchiarum TaxID=1114870 RepID=A0ABV5FJK8_9FLAO|nr:hypothetical protein [Flavobacterium branchiarum]MDN3675706.1 hypothetical protein [Flavobacterium branchiarum]